MNSSFGARSQRYPYGYVGIGFQVVWIPDRVLKEEAQNMIKKYTLVFHESVMPVRELVTKFGGQPVWVSTPQWPLSRMIQTPMKFGGQIQLYPEIFGEINAKMAYLFMSYELNKYDGIPETWDPEEGESAVILQPGVWNGPFIPLITGPWTGKDLGGWYRIPPPEAALEYTVELVPSEDPEIYSVEGNIWENPEKWKKYCNDCNESKIGGIPIPDASTPVFSPFPSLEEWSLLLQITASVPFEVNFGPDGIGTVFISKDGKQAFLQWRRS